MKKNTFDYFYLAAICPVQYNWMYVCVCAEPVPCYCELFHLHLSVSRNRIGVWGSRRMLIQFFLGCGISKLFLSVELIYTAGPPNEASFPLPSADLISFAPSFHLSFIFPSPSTLCPVPTPGPHALLPFFYLNLCPSTVLQCFFPFFCFVTLLLSSPPHLLLFSLSSVLTSDL